MMPQPMPPRFPGFDVMSEAGHWDPVTRELIESRLGPPPADEFFSETERATAAALCDQLTGQHESPRVPVLETVESRLAKNRTDGWHHETLPIDRETWRDSLAFLDADAMAAYGERFATVSRGRQVEVLTSIQNLGGREWHGMPAGQVWNLWMRYVCAAFYSHPWAWNEIGWPGPAYPRGYKNAGINKREPFEVVEAQAEQGPTRNLGPVRRTGRAPTS